MTVSSLASIELISKQPSSNRLEFVDAKCQNAGTLQ